MGKVKLELTPFLNEWWNVAFAITPRGLTTGPIPAGDGAFSVDFDFVDHALLVHTSDGRYRMLHLVPRTVADFYAEVLACLRALEIDVAINPRPVEIPHPIPFDVDTCHASYDPEHVGRWWRIMLQAEQILQRFHSPFVGKSSPVHFFWGAFDLATTRFSGRPATPPSGAPCFLQISETQENFACGFWPGNATMTGFELGEAAFYAYVYPAPPGFAEAAVLPDAACFHPGLGEFLLRYDDVRRSVAPDVAILDFFERSYRVAATLAGWDRQALERTLPTGAPR